MKEYGIKMPEKEYRTHPAISRSELWRMHESPEKFRYYKDFPPEATDALLFGQAFHKLALEPDTFFDEFDYEPSVDKRTKAGREVLAEWEEKLNGRTVVPSKMVLDISCMVTALRNDTFASRLLTGHHERSFFWTDADTGEECKCRTDNIYIGKKDAVIVDLKSTTDASTESFGREIFKYGYDFQAAMYTDGVRAVTGLQPTFVFLAVEKKPPYSINIIQLDEAVINHGYDTFRTLLGMYHDCKETGNWWGYMGNTHQINTVSLPPWLGGCETDE